MHFTITGKANCPKVAYAITIARHLQRNLPSFEFAVDLKTPEEWPFYISELQRLYGFNHSDCPTILEEGRLVGGLPEWKDLVWNLIQKICFFFIFLFYF